MNCKNCKAELVSDSDFCHRCGAQVIRNRLTFKNLFEHISETFFNYDNKLLRTLLDLFKKPEAVIVGYIDGVRKQYVNPISFFGLALTLSGIYMLILNKYFPETFDFSMLAVEGQEEMQARNMSFIQRNMSLVMMFYIPIYALIARITFIDLKRFNYTELLVVFMYWQAQISIISALITLLICSIFGTPQGIISIVSLPIMVIYAAYVLKRIYNLKIGQIIIRTLFFLVILLVFFMVATVIVAILMFLNGDMQEMIEAQQAAKKATAYTASAFKNWTS